MHGFKSFADKSVIEFKPGITGIVGPNGCGKSNINDAIRWVLGEQSAKSLRGSSMSDVIFNGSKHRKPQNLAEVTLVFDNSDRYIDVDYQEIEITRRLYRSNSEAEYLLNKKHCRLKDIVDLMLDTGLGRDSLSMISQGNIANFADAKPEERRSYFEEAAGVAKYKKRKEESLRHLSKTSENLDRVEDIINELSLQLQPLQRQKLKAERYLELKKQLEAIEISLIVHQTKKYKEDVDQLTKDIETLAVDEVTNHTNVVVITNKCEEARAKMVTLDHEVNQLQNDLIEAMNQVTFYTKQKSDLEAKRQYAISQSSDDLQAKLLNLKQQLQDEVNEYNDRVDRFEKLQEDVRQLQHQRQQLNQQFMDERHQNEQLSTKLQMARNTRQQLQASIESNSRYPLGVRTILSNRKSIEGFEGVLSELIDVSPGYEVALDVALGAATNYMIMKCEDDAKKAIAYLNKNKAGRATFLPMDVMQGRHLPQDTKTVLEGMDGYLGTAMNFIHYLPKYQDVLSSQLGHILIAKDLDAATNISHYTYRKYRVVSVDGGVVNIGGSMTGGTYKQNPSTSMTSLKKELEMTTVSIAQMEKDLIEKRGLYARLENELMELDHQVMQRQISKSQLEEIVKQKQKKVYQLKDQIEAISDEQIALEDFKSNDHGSEVIQKLNQANRRVDEITADIQIKRQSRMHYVDENNDYETNLRELNDQGKVLLKKKNECDVKKARLETLIENDLNRLNTEYQLTYERAKEQATGDLDFSKASNDVLHLRSEIQSLGSINLDAIESYETIHQRYNDLSHQKEDLLLAQDQILKAIAQMDQVTKKQFHETFEKVNIAFDDVFKRLFGGGHASLRYTNPEDILETGIDIDVQPPGKQVQNITLFSGGEKALIALSGLFAILTCRPVPMCLLDEVEAALDQANVERFAHFLKDFSKHTQFIVVTHRPGTMESCDALYGATMQESGVTKLVSVQLEDAVDLSV